MTACLICLRRIAETTSEISFDEILSEMFEILSNYMEWSPPPSYKFNFKSDPFPFCKECIYSVINLCTLHEQMAEIRTQINQASLQIQGKIIQSQNWGSIIKEKECSNRGLSQQEYLQRSDKIYTSQEKCNYYRRLIHKRFTPSVKLNLDLLREAPNCRRKTHYKDDSDKCSTLSKQDLQQAPFIERVFPDDLTTRTFKKEHEKVMLNNYLGLYRETSITKSNEKSADVLEYLMMGKHPLRSDYNLWICNICTFPFSKKSDFVDHMKICPGSKSSQLVPPGDIKRPLVAKVSIQPIIRKDVKLKDPDFASMTSENRETLINYLRLNKNQIYSNATSQGVNNFTVMYDGKYHFGRLSPNNRWCCIFCDENFVNMSYLTIHLKICPGCPPPNNTKQTFRYKRYIYDELTNGKFQCRHCRMLTTKLGITVHVDKCHVDRSTSSRTSPVRIPTKVTHKENKPRDCKEVCITERPYCCDICGEYFKERYEVLKHKASTHLRNSSKQNNIRCKVCGKIFLNLGLLVAHKKRYTNGTCCRLQNEIICKICKMNFASKALLCKHQLIHKDSRPFCCEFCRKTFKSKYAMRMHRAWTHLRNSHKKFACEICGDKFDRLLLLTLHDKVHEEVVVDEKIS